MADLPVILIVDDNNFIRMQISKILQDAGYPTAEAEGAEEGYKILEDQFDSVGCVLVDVRMEPFDGFDFIGRMQANSLHKPIILVTGDQTPDILSKASVMNVSFVLMKPVQKDRLLKMVDRAIATYRPPS